MVTPWSPKHDKFKSPLFHVSTHRCLSALHLTSGSLTFFAQISTSLWSDNNVEEKAYLAVGLSVYDGANFLLVEDLSYKL